eukprot:s7490_g4.t2
MRDAEAGRSNLNLSEVDDSLGKALGHSNELEKRAQHLQVHFQKAMKGIGDINRLCDEADASVARNQALLNRSAHRIHDLNERLQQLIKVSTDGRESVASAGSGVVEVPQKRGAETRLKTSKSKPSAGVRRLVSRHSAGAVQARQSKQVSRALAMLEGTGDYCLETTMRPQAAARPSPNADELSKAEAGMSSSQSEVPQLCPTKPERSARRILSLPLEGRAT